MKATSSLKFEHIYRINIHDLRAQKKTINYKQFFDIPLTFEETIAKKILNSKNHIAQNLSKTHSAFKIKKLIKIPKKKL